MSRIHSTIRAVREPFGTAGLIVAIVALVFAMLGGAYAATAGSSHKKKTKVVKGPRGPRGLTGAEGPPGPAGADGKNGSAGAPGKNGTSVISEAEPKGANCAEGGTKIIGASTTYACNGQPWTAGGTLPKERTETGTWSVSGRFKESGDPVLIPISFPIPLAAALDESHVHFIPSPTIAELGAGEFPKGGAACKESTVQNPKAAPGNLCVFYVFDASLLGGEGGIHVESIQNPEALGEAGAGTTGAFMRAEAKFSSPPSALENLQAWGTWAVTAP